MKRNSRRRMTAVASAAAAALIASGGTYALASQGAGTLSACVHHRGGTLYEAAKCARHDRRLTWSKIGPQGPAGPPGPAGKNGANGSNGTNGTNGTNGANGIGATTSTVALTPNGNNTIATVGSTASMDATCGVGSGDVHFVIGFAANENWQVAGSYSTYQLQANGTAIVANGSATTPIGTYAIANNGPQGYQHIAYTVIPTTTPGLLTGSMQVTLTGVSPANYVVNFEVETEPGAANECQGQVTVYPAS